MPRDFLSRFVDRCIVGYSSLSTSQLLLQKTHIFLELNKYQFPQAMYLRLVLGAPGVRELRKGKKRMGERRGEERKKREAEPPWPISTPSTKQSHFLEDTEWFKIIN